MIYLSFRFHRIARGQKKNLILATYGVHAISTWLGWLGSDQRISDSESDALPLGYTPRQRLFYYPCRAFQ